MGARESQRDLIRLAAHPSLEGPSALSADAVGGAAEPHAFLDLLSVRQILQDNTSTSTSLESLACSIDLRDDPEIKNLKRNRDLITSVGKESQLKEQIKIFKAYPDCFTKRSRTD